MGTWGPARWVKQLEPKAPLPLRRPSLSRTFCCAAAGWPCPGWGAARGTEGTEGTGGTGGNRSFGSLGSSGGAKFAPPGASRKPKQPLRRSELGPKILIRARAVTSLCLSPRCGASANGAGPQQACYSARCNQPLPVTTKRRNNEWGWARTGMLQRGL